MNTEALQNVRIEDSEGIRVIFVHRPKALNALNEQTLNELLDVLKDTAESTMIGACILTGSGEKSFVAGADIAHMSTIDPLEAKRFAQLGHRVMAQIEELPQPILAAVNGFALGGGTELALACDFIYASEKAIFGQPEVKLGLIPGFGGTQRLMRKIPSGMARELILVGTTLSAQEALQCGLINRVVPAEEGTVLDAARATAQTILKRSQHAVRSAKSLLVQGTDVPLQQANAMEIEAFALLFATDHPKEGTTAFIEKRTPVFSSLESDTNDQ